VRKKIHFFISNINWYIDKTVISEYIVECNYSFDWEGIKIMDRESNFYKEIVSEMVHKRTKIWFKFK